jgi:hypothetical protein
MHMPRLAVVRAIDYLKSMDLSLLTGTFGDQNWKG